MLDRIWQSNEPDEEAKRIVENGSADDLLSIAALDYIIEHNIRNAEIKETSPETIQIEFQSPFSGTANISRSDDGDARLWRTEGQRLGDIFLKSPIDRGETASLDLVALLRLAQIARDHSDSIIMLPPDLRSSRIGELAVKFSVSEEHVRNAFVTVDAAVR